MTQSPDKQHRKRLLRDWRFWAATACVTAALLGSIGLSLRAAVANARLEAPSPTEIVYDRNGAFLTQVAHGPESLGYGYWPLRQIPKRLALATLALEDRRFDEHPGVDPLALARAAWRNLLHRGPRQGGSTIAMQVARMQNPKPRGLVNKLDEALSALALVARHGREAVLLHYLRLAPYGAGSHGAAHAARFYFNKPVEDLSWAETALLAAIPQAPGRMNLARASGLRRAATRAARAIDALARQRALDREEAALAKAQLLAMRPIETPKRPQALHLALRYAQLLREGRIEAEPHDPRLHASIDLDLETRMERLARRYLDGFRDAGARQVAIMVAERQGGNHIVAEVGSARFGGKDAGSFDFTRTARSPGSTLKPFVYALAFERGVLESTDLLADVPEGASGVNNADGLYLGPMTPRQALANSRNVPAANLIRRVGVEANFQFLHEIGLHELEAPAESFGVSMAIGSLPTQLGKLTRAYAMLADDGVLSDLIYAKEQRLGAARRALSLDTARLVTSMLADPQARLPTFPRYGPLEYPFAVAVKTGTSQGYRDAWTLAFSKRFIVGVWIGRADAGTMREISGAASSARLAHAALVQLHGAKPGEIEDDAFLPPPDRIALDACLEAGAQGSCAATLREWAKPGAALPVAPAARPANAERLVIATPEADTHIWRNPEQPAAVAKIALKLAPLARAEQIVWYVDGEPFRVAETDETVFWPLRPGQHQIEARRALQPGRSRSVRVVVE
ncbi:transglycosylase domain-containing protein [Methylocystis bryophila]|uniref:transglycosylase domain-containing protein n=1 Tax=Methylocystis bryophila TaxID=655015 RepID=UPI001FD919E7|nr:transglycosylase domain-containing protein [Methylocystis bryophila]